MLDLTNWNLYYNKENDPEWGLKDVRANLVYTARVSPDKKTFCLDFTRDPAYHRYEEENAKWTDYDLQYRFENEIHYNLRAKKYMPTLEILDIDYKNRRVFTEWHGNDFLMQAYEGGGYDAVLPDWKEQWTALISKMWSVGISKCSLHPNSWTVKDGVLIPFNWFFCYDFSNPPLTIRSFLIQVSEKRLEKMNVVLKQNGYDVDTPYPVKQLQKVVLNSFRSNYDAELIDEMHRILDVLRPN
jgi:hypothetical protein